MTTTTDDAGQRTLTPFAGVVDAAPDPLAGLAAVADLRRELAVIERAFVDAARAAGTSFSAIGESLGVSKQAAQRRFTQEPVADTDVAPKEPRPARVGDRWVVTTRRGRVLLRVRRPS